MTDTPTTPTDTDLRDRIATALDAAHEPSDNPEVDASRRHSAHQGSAWCYVCQGDTMKLADAALAAVRPELDRLRGEQEVYAELYSSMGTHAFELRESRESLRHLAAGLGDERTDAWVRIARALELHSEFRIYDGCGHQHIDDDPGTFEVEDVGLICDEGYEYSICRECCTGGTGYQSEMCVGSHTRPCWPCPTHTALTGPAAEAGTEADR